MSTLLISASNEFKFQDPKFLDVSLPDSVENVPAVFNCLDNFNTVQSVSTLSIQFQHCSDSVNTVQVV